MPDELSRQVADRVNQLLEQRGWSGRELARRTGMPPASMTRKLSGVTAFDLDDLPAIASALDVSARELLPQV